MSVTINGTSGLVFNDASTQATAATGFGFKNRIINGAMMIDQRNAGASVTNTTSTIYSLDRWQLNGSQASKFTVQQNAGSVTPPTGFTNYLGVTSSSAYSIGAGDYFNIAQAIEGLNIADLGWGTANASTVTLSFWVRSSLTGTFGGSITNSAYSRSYPYTYTISSANTWEQKTITIAGDTTGTWLTTNEKGMNVLFGLGVGSTYSGTAGAWAGTNYNSATGATSVVGTSGATFYITGVQLEKGSTATSFDVRPYGTELDLCERYCVKYGGSKIYEHVGQGNAYSTSAVVFDIVLPTTMRTTPSYTVSGNWTLADGNTNTNITGFGLASGGAESSPFILACTAATAGGLTQFRPYFVFANNSLASSLIVSAEL
jgi:hypothetical protein